MHVKPRKNMVCMQMKKFLMMASAVMMAVMSAMAQSGVFVRTEAALNNVITTVNSTDAVGT